MSEEPIWSSTEPFRLQDEQVWVWAWIASAQHSKTEHPQDCSQWADACLADFRARFGK